MILRQRAFCGILQVYAQYKRRDADLNTEIANAVNAADDKAQFV